VISCRRALAISFMLAVFAPITSGDLGAATLITTESGDTFEGEVISAGVNSLTVKLDATGYKIIPLNIIDRIKVDIDDGSPVEGKLLDWSDGELTVRVGDRDVSVREGTIVSVREVTVPAGGPEVSPPVEPAAADLPPAGVAPADVTPAEATVVAPVVEPEIELELEPEPAEPESAPLTNATM